MKAGVEARLVASTAVGRVLRGGAWSNRIVDEIGADLSDRDRGLVRFLVYGTLRNRRRIDRMLSTFIERPLSHVTPEVLDTLRIGVQEIVFGETPDHAAVSVAVDAAREGGHTRAAGFVNGVLRRAIRDGEPAVETGDLATTYSLADDVVERLVAAWGTEWTDAFLAGSHGDAARHVRLRPGQSAPEGARPASIPDVVEVPPGPLDGGFIVQDGASAAVGLAAGDLTGLRVFDMAAAPGGKTLHLADRHPGFLVAGDAHPKRLNRARARAARHGLAGHWLVADGTRAPFPDATFDVVVLDAPCTGLGTLRRRPELRERASAAEIDRLAALQARLLAEAIRLTRPDGRVVYSVCTITKEETIDIVEPVGGVRPPDLPGGDIGSGVMLAPHLTGTDGMFISVIEPRGVKPAGTDVDSSR